MKKYKIGLRECMALLILPIAMFCICSTAKAGDYKACVIEYKTDKGLCKQIADSLNVKKHIDNEKFFRTGVLMPGESSMITIIRQYRGLAFEIVPDVLGIGHGKAVLIYEEVEK